MKKKIAILGSTGSIGKTLIEIIRKDKKNFKIVLLSADENYQELLKQAKLFNAPKDNDGSCITVGECIDNVIDQLSEELKRRGQEI